MTLYDLEQRWRDTIDVEDENYLIAEDTHVATMADPAYRRGLIEHELLGMARAVKQLTAEAEMLQHHIAETNGRLQARQNRIASLKAWMLNLMQQEGIERVKDPLATVYTQKNPPSCEVTDEAQVPNAYKRVTASMPWAVAKELLPDDVLATARVDVLRQKIIDDMRLDGTVPEGVSVTTDAKHLRVI